MVGQPFLRHQRPHGRGLRPADVPWRHLCRLAAPRLADRFNRRHRYRQRHPVFVHPTDFRFDLLRPLEFPGGTRGRSQQRLSGAVFADHLDHERTKYVHLLDGGISDNLALRGVANGGIALDDTTDTFRRVALQTRRVLVLSVDSQSATDPAISKQRVMTGLSQIFGAVSGTQINAYNFETLTLANAELDQLKKSLVKVRCAQARGIE